MRRAARTDSPARAGAATAAALTVTALLAGACGSDPTGPLADTDFLLAFVTNRDGNDEVYGLDVDGGTHNLTNDPAHDRAPVWSPDGHRIAFTRQSGAAREVMVLDLGRGSLTNVSVHPTADDYDPRWSPDGRRLAFVSDRDGNLEIYTVRADGSELTNLTRHTAPDRDPDWSIDGRLIAFTSGRDLRTAIYQIASNGGGLTRLTSGALADDEKPRWSTSEPELLIFQSNRDGASELVLLHTGQRREEVLAPDPAHDVDVAWGPRVAFLSNRDDPFWDVWVMNPDGTGVAKLALNSSGREARPTWSPDGTQIAFETRRSGNWDVWLADADGTKPRPLTTDGANDGSVTWRPLPR